MQQILSDPLKTYKFFCCGRGSGRSNVFRLEEAASNQSSQRAVSTHLKRNLFGPRTRIPAKKNNQRKKLDKPKVERIRKAIVYLPGSPIGQVLVRRCIGVILFLFVFTLPLHFHPATESSQVSQECNCYYGGRTQLGPAPVLVILVPIYEVVLLDNRRAENPTAVVIESESARAPPPYSL